MQVDSTAFRNVLGYHPTGVCVITSLDAHVAPVGLVVGSFTSISLKPPLVGFFVGRESTTWPRIMEAGHFCVNVLGKDQAEICRQFSKRPEDKFCGISHRPSALTSPILCDAVAWIDCKLNAVVETGDHYLVMGAVKDLAIQRQTPPLVFCQGGFGHFAAVGRVSPPEPADSVNTAA